METTFRKKPRGGAFSACSAMILIIISLHITACSKSESNAGTGSPELSLSITSNVDSYSSLNEIIELAYLVTNGGASTLTGSLHVTSAIEDVSCSLPPTADNNDMSLPAGESVTCFSSYVVTQDDLDTGSIVITANAAVADVSAKESSITVYAMARPELSFSLSSLATAYAAVDEVIEYNYLLTNVGNISLPGPVIVNNNWQDVSCAELETIGNNDTLLQPGESVTCSSIYRVTEIDLQAGAITNTAIATVDGISSTEENITINSLAESLFIFPFDTTDPSVVFRATLTSAASIAQAGGFEETGSLNEFDSLLGMSPAAAANGTPGCRFTSGSIAGLASLPEGQLSIEIEREWLAITDSEVGSSGYDHPDIEYLLSYGATGTGKTGQLYMQPDESLLFRFFTGEGTRNARFINSNQSSPFARLTLSWEPDEASLYVDGLLIGTIPRTDSSDNRFSSIFLGTIRGTDANGFDSKFFMRNIIVSSKPVISKSQPLLRHIMHLGDSFAAGLPLFNTPAKYDGTIVNTVIRELFMNGATYEKFTVYSNGGGKIQDSSNDPLESDVNGSGKTRIEALAEDPSIIVFITGGNDLGIFQTDLFTNDLHDHVEAFLGVNGHLPTNVQHVIITTTTSNLSASSSTLLEMRDIMLKLPEWWDTTYPELSGRVHVIDTWLLFGGFDADHTLFGVIDTIHPSAAGNIVYGRAIASEIERLVNQ